VTLTTLAKKVAAKASPAAIGLAQIRLV
jgi:hypothetical protein